MRRNVKSDDNNDKNNEEDDKELFSDWLAEGLKGKLLLFWKN